MCLFVSSDAGSGVFGVFPEGGSQATLLVVDPFGNAADEKINYRNVYALLFSCSLF